jgi:hypothetical protein
LNYPAGQMIRLHVVALNGNVTAKFVWFL